jgi:hypothetical protein
MGESEHDAYLRVCDGRSGILAAAKSNRDVLSKIEQEW